MGVRRVMPVFQSDDPTGSGQFYAEVLGLEIAMDLGWIVTYAAPDNRSAQISTMSADATAPVPPDVSIEVDDVDAAHAAAERLGCEIVHPLSPRSEEVEPQVAEDDDHRRGGDVPPPVVPVERAGRVQEELDRDADDREAERDRHPVRDADHARAPVGRQELGVDDPRQGEHERDL